MTTYKQVKACNIAKMGKTKGMCLQNVKQAFGITPSGTSAKVQLAAVKSAGWFHTGAAPTNVAVPVWLNTNSQYGHVMISLNGVIYSDGYKTNVAQAKLLGWAEGICGVRIVQAVSSAPATPSTPSTGKKSNEEIANEVIAGKWGNGDDRKKRLADAGYDYNAIQTIVNQKVNGGNTSPAPTPAPSGALKVGDTVKITKWVDYTNRPLRQLDGTYKIMQLNGNRAVVTRNGGIYAAISTDNLARA